MLRGNPNKINIRNIKNKIIENKVVKLIDKRHALLGDNLDAVTGEILLKSIGVPFFGGDIAELKENNFTHTIQFGGGNFIHETGNKEDSILYNWGLLEATNKNRKVALIGCGYNECIENNPFQNDWETVIRKAAIISLRDKESITKNSSLSGHNNVSCAPSPSFLLRKYCDLSFPRVKGTVSYSISKHIDISVHRYMIDSLHKDGMSICFLPHGEEDKIFYLSENLLNKNDFIIDLRDNPLAALQVLSATEFHVTSRLHGLITCVITNTPFVHINWGMDKVKWQVDMVGLNNYEYGFDKEAILDIEFLSIRNRIIEIENKLIVIAEKAVLEAEHHFVKLKEFLGK